MLFRSGALEAVSINKPVEGEAETQSVAGGLADCNDWMLVIRHTDVPRHSCTPVAGWHMAADIRHLLEWSKYPSVPIRRFSAQLTILDHSVDWEWLQSCQDFCSIEMLALKIKLCHVC